MDGSRDVIIQGLSLEEVIGFIHRKNKRYQAMTLQDLEALIPKNSKEFKLIRKLILDYYNDYTRAIINTIFGDIESYIYKKDGRSG